MTREERAKFDEERKLLSTEDNLLFDWQKIDPKIKATLTYKEGDFVEVHVGYNGERPTGKPDDIHNTMQLIYVRWYSREDKDVNKVIYGVKDIGADDEESFEVFDQDIIRKLEYYEVEAEKYNL